MAMSKKDYIAFAKMLREYRETVNGRELSLVEADDLCIELANFFLSGNSRFDHGKFLAACGVIQK